MIPIQPPSTLYRRPTVLNWLHALGLFKAHTQTNDKELSCLASYSKDRKIALEIGSYMGVSAGVIAKTLAPEGRLFCVDPWPRHRGKEDPSWTICRREIRRKCVESRVVFLHGTSWEMQNEMPPQLDFIFVDGDHSYKGLQADWTIVVQKLESGGIVCLHDTTIPAAEPYRQFGSVIFFDEVIRPDQRFTLVECCYSMNVLQRVS